MKVLHLITDLEVGGAESMLFNLLNHSRPEDVTDRVVSLTGIGVIGSRIQGLGIQVQDLGMRPGQPDPRALSWLIRDLRKDPPDLIQTWMYHADLLGGLAARLSGNIPVIWGIHHTLDGSQPVRNRTMAVLRLNAVLSRWLPYKVVCCAEAAFQTHIRAGYAPTKMIVIPNGVDLGEFQPDPQASLSLHRELGLDPEIPLIGLLARFHPQKHHQIFAEAAGLLHAHLPRVHFVLAGEGVSSANTALLDWFQAAGVLAQVHLLGLRQDAPRLMAGLDIVSLTSGYGEALPMVIAEAMACGTPCVATDVGDTARLVDGTGRVVRPRDPQSLAAAWADLLDLPILERRRLGQMARSRVREEYNIVTVVERYYSLYLSALVSDTDS